MSELEFEEVKGLRDLGFTFSDAGAPAAVVGGGGQESYGGCVRRGGIS